MKNKLRSFVTFALILFVSSATAGIVFVGVGGNYIQPESAPVSISKCPGDFNLAQNCIRIRTTGFQGVMTLDCSGIPECESLEPDCTDIRFTQELVLNVDRETGTAEGRTRGQLGSDGDLRYRGNVRGTATCLPDDGRPCAQMVVDLQVNGVMADRNNLAAVGRLRTDMVGSMVWDVVIQT